MKTIILKVEVPNDAEIIDVNIQYSNGQFDNVEVAEIQLPTEGEVINQFVNEAHTRDARAAINSKIHGANYILNLFK